MATDADTHAQSHTEMQAETHAGTEPGMNPGSGSGPTEMDQPIVTHRPERNRFEVAVGGKRVGLAEYAEDHGRRIFFHTEVDDDHSGQGLAGTLIRRALDATREDGLRIVPVCPYVAAFVKRHHDWDDILERADREALAAVKQATR